MRGRVPGIFYRHVLRELAAQTLIVAIVLLAILVIYQFSFVLGRAADGQIEGATVPRLVLLSLRTNLGVILPLAVLLGVVLGLGRLYYDSEITAAQASGIGRATLYAAAAAVALPAALLAAWVAFIDGPAAARDAVQLRLEALRTAATRGLAAGGFRAVGEGLTLHFAARDADGSLRDVFLQRDLPPDASADANTDADTSTDASIKARANATPRTQVVLASTARYRLSEAGDAIEVELLDGQSYEGAPGHLDWRVMQFDRQHVRLPAPQARLPGPPRLDGLDNRELLGSTEPRHRGELHWRIGWVAAVLALGFIAVPLARLAPGQGRQARIPLAVLLFAVHAGLLVSGKTMLERGETPAALGLWWVHAVVLLLALAIVVLPGVVARARARRGAAAH